MALQWNENMSHIGRIMHVYTQSGFQSGDKIFIGIHTYILMVIIKLLRCERKSNGNDTNDKSEM